jgi:hypothetical protein
MPDGQGPLSPEQIAFEEELGVREPGAGAYPVAGPEIPAPVTGGTFMMPPEMLQQPKLRAQWSPTAQAYIDPETQTVLGAGGGGTGGMGPVPAAEPAMPGMGMGAGGGGAGIAPELSPEQAVEYRAGAVLGEQGVQAVQQLRQQGVPEEQIRARLGMGPPPAPSAAALTAPARPAGVGGMMRAPRAPELPPGLQRPYETLYPPDWTARVYEAEAAGTIDAATSKKLLAGYEAWQKTPEGAVAAAREHEREGLTEIGRIEQEQALEEQRRQAQYRALYEQQVAKGTAEAAAQKAWQDDYDTELKEQTARYERSIEEAKRARIDPDRARIPIIDALAAAAGQFAAIMTGTPNAALQQINARLDRDVAAQEQTIKDLQTNVAMRRNRLGLLRERLGDRQAAVAAEKRLQLEQVQAELNRIATDSKIEQNRLGAAKLATELDVQIQAMKDDENTRNALASQELAAMRHQQRLASANALALQRQRAQQQAEMQASGMGPWQTGKGVGDMRKRYVKGHGFVADAATAKTLNQDIVMSERIIGNVRRLKELMSQPGYATDLKAQAEAESLKTGTMFAMRYKEKTGALDAGSTELFDKRLKINKVMTASAIAGLDQTARDTRAGLDAAIAQEQITPGEYGVTPHEKTGAPVEGYRIGLPGRQQQRAPKVTEIPHQ